MKRNIVIIGAGTMGNGIAHTFAQNNFEVTLIDINQNSLDKALKTISNNLDRMVTKEKISLIEKNNTLNNITTKTNINSTLTDVDLVIEAATENLDIKIEIFKELDTYYANNTI